MLSAPRGFSKLCWHRRPKVKRSNDACVAISNLDSLGTDCSFLLRVTSYSSWCRWLLSFRPADEINNSLHHFMLQQSLQRRSVARLPTITARKGCHDDKPRRQPHTCLDNASLVVFVPPRRPPGPHPRTARFFVFDLR